MVYIGHEKRIEELRAVLDKIPTSAWLFFGGGPYTDSLKEVCKGFKTVFTGILRGQPLQEAYESGDVLNMPSDSEKLGFVVPDGLDSGVPVIGLCVLSFSIAISLRECFLSFSLSLSLPALAAPLSHARALSLSLSLAPLPSPLPLFLPPFLSPSLPLFLPPSLPLCLSVSASISLSFYVLSEVGYSREIRLLKYQI